MNWKQMAFSAVAGLILGLILGTDIHCGPSFTAPLSVPGSHTTSITTVRDTITTERIIYRDRWHVRSTPAQVTIDTLREVEPSPAYVATLDTITPNLDTVGITYRHPERTFEMSIGQAPDTVRTVYVNRVDVVTVKDRKRWGFGFSMGPGLQLDADGTVRAGAQVSVGVNFNLWEP